MAGLASNKKTFECAWFCFCFGCREAMHRVSTDIWTNLGTKKPPILRKAVFVY